MEGGKWKSRGGIYLYLGVCRSAGVYVFRSWYASYGGVNRTGCMASRKQMLLARGRPIRFKSAAGRVSSRCIVKISVNRLHMTVLRSKLYTGDVYVTEKLSKDTLQLPNLSHSASVNPGHVFDLTLPIYTITYTSNAGCAVCPLKLPPSPGPAKTRRSPSWLCRVRPPMELASVTNDAVEHPTPCVS